MLTIKEVEKKYWKIGEVAELLKVEPSCIRFWLETFRLSIKQGRGGVRFFTSEDIDDLDEIHRLLKVEKYTIEGAIKKFGGRQRGRPANDGRLFI